MIISYFWRIHCMCIRSQKKLFREICAPMLTQLQSCFVHYVLVRAYSLSKRIFNVLQASPTSMHNLMSPFFIQQKKFFLSVDLMQNKIELWIKEMRFDSCSCQSACFIYYRGHCKSEQQALEKSIMVNGRKAHPKFILTKY